MGYIAPTSLLMDFECEPPSDEDEYVCLSVPVEKHFVNKLLSTMYWVVDGDGHDVEGMLGELITVLLNNDSTTQANLSRTKEKLLTYPIAQRLEALYTASLPGGNHPKMVDPVDTTTLQSVITSIVWFYDGHIKLARRSFITRMRDYGIIITNWICEVNPYNQQIKLYARIEW